MKKLDGEEYGTSLVRNRAKNFGQFEKKKLWTNCNVKENVKKKKKMKKTCRQKKVSLMEKDLLIVGAMVLGLPCCKRQKCLEFNC